MRGPKKISIEVKFTEGYQKRFTEAVLKIYSKRIEAEIDHDIQGKEVCDNLPQDKQERVS